MRRFDPEMMEEVRIRMERIRDYVPAEEFNKTAALMIAKREIEPLHGGGTDGD